MNETPLPILYTVEEVADILHIGRLTVFQLIRNGHIQSIRLGRSRRIPLPAISSYVDTLVEHKTKTPTEHK